jgi:hypothetical protein
MPELRLQEMTAQPVFYDFEASGIAGFPIEIGWAWPDGNNVKSDSLLISPADGWDTIGNWETQAEKIHGISLALLKREGLPAASVVSRLNKCLGGRTLYSDSHLDTKWMAQLFTATQLRPAFDVHLMPAGELVDDLRQTMELSRAAAAGIAENVGRKFPHTHRARTDALYWAELWSAFSREELEIQPSKDAGHAPGRALHLAQQ